MDILDGFFQQMLNIFICEWGGEDKKAKFSLKNNTLLAVLAIKYMMKFYFPRQFSLKPFFLHNLRPFLTTCPTLMFLILNIASSLLRVCQANVQNKRNLYTIVPYLCGQHGENLPKHRTARLYGSGNL